VKRFTSTDKWRDPWFRRLCPTSKLLWLWIVDHCDNAGVVDLDVEAAAFDIGEVVEEHHLAELASRLERLKSGKYFIPKFISFQFGALSAKCVPHLRVLELLSLHGIQYPKRDDSSTTLVPTDSPSLPSTFKEKDKEKDKEEDKDRGGVGEAAEVVKLRGLVSKWFHRRETTQWGDKELKSLAKIETSDEDTALLDAYYSAEIPSGDYRRKDVLTLLNNWQGEVDRARRWKREGQLCKAAPTLSGLRQQKEAIEELLSKHPANKNGVAYRGNPTEEQRKDYLRLKAERDAALREIAGGGK